MMAGARGVKVSDEARPKIGVLISGRGSNLQALIDAVSAGTLAADLRLVISNCADAAGLARAAAAGIETLVLPHRSYSSRASFDRALVDALKARDVAFVCLAGFMRLLGPEFCAAFPGAVLNIHPSLLPAFPGVDAQRQALEHGVKITGATVHFVTPELVGGINGMMIGNAVATQFGMVSNWPLGAAMVFSTILVFLLALGALLAVRRLRDAGRPVTYDIVGEEADGGATRHAVHDLGLADVVRLVPPTGHDAVADHLARADALLLPSLSEGIANAALEAMACARPVVVTDCGGMTEAVRKGNTGTKLLFHLRG